MLFTEIPFIQRFEAAHDAGFKAAEFLFPYDFKPEGLAEKLSQFNLEQALFNMPPGDWDAGERGYAALPGREKGFKASADTALIYAEALRCAREHAMSGIVNPDCTYQEHVEIFIQNIRYAADALQKELAS